MKRVGKGVMSILLAILIVVGMAPASGFAAPVYADGSGGADDNANASDNADEAQLPKIIVEVGNGHEELAAKWADSINSEDSDKPYFLNASASGSTVTLYYDETKDLPDSDYPDEGKDVDGILTNAQRRLSNSLEDDCLDGSDSMDNGEMLNMWSIGQYPIEHYTSSDEIQDEMLSEEKEPLQSEQTFYVIWNTKPLDELIFTIEQPVCGKS